MIYRIDKWELYVMVPFFLNQKLESLWMLQSIDFQYCRYGVMRTSVTLDLQSAYQSELNRVEALIIEL